MDDPLGDILGQGHALASLRAAVAADRVHHAWIFHGPAGVGKCTTALAFGRWLIERDGPGLFGGDAPPPAPVDAGESEADDDEVLLRRTGHPDLHLVTKELARYSSESGVRARKLTSIPVEVVREALIGPVYRAAQAGGRKVFIVDEAELLNATGQNALLKTLEEPPAGTTIVLVTSSEDRLLPTIRSRCQRVAFVPLPDDVVRSWVAEHAAGFPGEWVDWLVRFSGGSIGRAKLAADWGLVRWAERVLPALEGATRGRPDGRLGADMAALIDGFAKAWVDAHKNASKEAANKQAADLMWTLLTNDARHRMQLLAEGLAPGDALAGDATLEPWLGVIDAVEYGRELQGSNVNLGMVCDYVATRLAAVVSRVAAEA